MTVTHQRPTTDQANLIFAVFARLHDTLRQVDYQTGIVSVREGRAVHDFPFHVDNDVLHYNGKRYCVKPKGVAEVVADFTVRRDASMIVFTAQSEGAKAKVPDFGLESWQMLGEHSFAVEFRMAFGFRDQLVAEGFTITDG